MSKTLSERYDWYETHRQWLQGEGGACANLRGADLMDADLRGADLRDAKGIYLLAQSDHGYLIYATQRDSKWRILGGCRNFTIVQARRHWGAKTYHSPSSGRRIVACLDWLEAELKREKNEPHREDQDWHDAGAAHLDLADVC